LLCPPAKGGCGGDKARISLREIVREARNWSLALAIPNMRELSEAAAALVAGFLGGYCVAGGSSSVGVTCALIALVYRARVYIQVCARANPHPKERDPVLGVCA
jgi:hypothetical protein